VLAVGLVVGVAVELVVEGAGLGRVALAMKPVLAGAVGAEVSNK